jgi:hypothetical protein
MASAADEQPLTALNRVTELANEIARHHPGGHELVKQLFAEFARVLREQYRKPQAIETAPKERDRKLLLYCPKQGGWEVGEWSGERWISTRKIEFLDPTHWVEAPPDPPA